MVWNLTGKVFLLVYFNDASQAKMFRAEWLYLVKGCEAEKLSKDADLIRVCILFYGNCRKWEV